MERLAKYFEFMDNNWRQVLKKNPKADIPQVMNIILNSWRKKQAEPNSEKEANSKKGVASYDGKGLENPYLMEMCSANHSDDRVSDHDTESEEEVTEAQKERLNDILPPSYRKSRNPNKSFVPPIKKNFPFCAALMRNKSGESLRLGDIGPKKKVDAKDDNLLQKESLIIDVEAIRPVNVKPNIIEKMIVIDSETQVEHKEEVQVIVDDDNGKTDENSYGCKKCGKKFKQLKSSKVHQCAVPTKVPCPSCSKLISKSNLSHHMKTHFNGKKLQCKKCSLSFNSAHEKQEHMKTKLHNCCPCNTCGKVFRRPSLLNEHMRIHKEENEANTDEENEKTKEENKYYCKFCLKKFGSVTSLQKHMTKKHPELGEKCKQCSKIFFSKRGLTRHTLLHEMVTQKQGQVSEPKFF